MLLRLLRIIVVLAVVWLLLAAGGDGSAGVDGSGPAGGLRSKKKEGRKFCGRVASVPLCIARSAQIGWLVGEMVD